MDTTQIRGVIAAERQALERERDAAITPERRTMLERTLGWTRDAERCLKIFDNDQTTGHYRDSAVINPWRKRGLPIDAVRGFLAAHQEQLQATWLLGAVTADAAAEARERIGRLQAAETTYVRAQADILRDSDGPLRPWEIDLPKSAEELADAETLVADFFLRRIFVLPLDEEPEPGDIEAFPVPRADRDSLAEFLRDRLAPALDEPLADLDGLVRNFAAECQAASPAPGQA